MRSAPRNPSVRLALGASTVCAAAAALIATAAFAGTSVYTGTGVKDHSVTVKVDRKGAKVKHLLVKNLTYKCTSGKHPGPGAVGIGGHARLIEARNEFNYPARPLKIKSDGTFNYHYKVTIAADGNAHFTVTARGRFNGDVVTGKVKEVRKFPPQAFHLGTCTGSTRWKATRA
jgi:hypothetical protein